jgi:hypothetical protein
VLSVALRVTVVVNRHAELSAELLNPSDSNEGVPQKYASWKEIGDVQDLYTERLSLRGTDSDWPRWR